MREGNRSGHAERRKQSAKGRQTPLPAKPSGQCQVPAERAASLLERVLAVYEKNFSEHSEAGAYLEARGIVDAGLFVTHRAGFSTGKLSDILPYPKRRPAGEDSAKGGNVRHELSVIGILLEPESVRTAPTRERFARCVVFPGYDEGGQLAAVYGYSIDEPESRQTQLFLPGRSACLWNARAIKTHSQLIITHSVIDALSVMVAGFRNVVARPEPDELNGEDIRMLRHHGVTDVVLLSGDKADTGRFRAEIGSAGIAVRIKALPSGHDPNSYLIGEGAGVISLHGRSAFGKEKSIDIHTIRRTCATHMLRGGAHPVVVAQMLGHSGLRSLSHYLRTNITDLMAAHAKTKPGQ